MLKYLIGVISRTLSFSKVEAKGTLVLILIIIIGITASRLYIHHLRSSELPTTNSDLKEWVKTVKASIEVKERNDIIETINQPDYAHEHLDMKKSNPENVSRITKILKTPIVIKDINLATPEELQQIKGIGPVYSSRIVKYRDLLGGFSKTDQLKEVYGLNDTTIHEILQHFTIQSPPKKIPINSDSVKILATHPYITYDLAWIIINYRKQNGDILSFEDLQKIKAIDEETLSRIRPYLD